ncbi:response regulator receiver domain [Candidatus Palauibacter sp.]|uniref:response regulator receiver domain n=1 Tax=Candidatus Palauibacter sp. TaxID=3101350 RepID=UPI003B023D4A
MPTSDFDRHCREIAKRFLLTAVVVDDQRYFPTPPPTGRPPRTPTRGDVARPRALEETRGRQRQDIDAPALTDSFAKHGMVCGVVAPGASATEGAPYRSALARADILVLDWKLHDNNDKLALELVTGILSGDRGDRLRLIAVYTGEPGLLEIREQIVSGLEALGRPVESSEANCEIASGPCRIVMYAKAGTPTPGLKDRTVDEDALPDRLIDDFTRMVTGLVPSLVLTSLTTVRENVYRVLERFDAKLDPAFLAHRACLAVPAESEQHMVEQIGSELHGIMDDAVLEARKRFSAAVEYWLTEKSEEGPYTFGDREVSLSDSKNIFNKGLGEGRGGLGASYYDKLSAGVAMDGSNGQESDMCLASKMCFRTVLERGTRTLRMGTVVRRRDANAGEGTNLVCVTPRCDCVRVKEESPFLFLPLVRAQSGMFQLVLPPLGDGMPYEPVAVGPKTTRWVRANFNPETETNSGTIKASTIEADGDARIERFVFKDVRDNLYDWVGELKPEFAQRVAQVAAARLSDVALNKSEWLRRKEQ